MTDYWSLVEPYWNDCPLDDPAAFLTFYNRMPPVARDLLTSHWLQSEVCNGGFHQLFTNPTGVLVPEAIAGLRAAGLGDLADISAEAAAFFGERYPREQMRRIGALDCFAAHAGTPDQCNPFAELDERFYSLLDVGHDGEDAFTAAANAYAARH